MGTHGSGDAIDSPQPQFEWQSVEEVEGTVGVQVLCGVCEHTCMCDGWTIVNPTI